MAFQTWPEGHADDLYNSDTFRSAGDRLQSTTGMNEVRDCAGAEIMCMWLCVPMNRRRGRREWKHEFLGHAVPKA